MIVRCTARLLKLLTPIEVSDVPSAPDEWYANLVWIDRRKCLLLLHADTLFSVFVADVRKPQLAIFGHYLAGTVATALGWRLTVSARWIPRRCGWRGRPAAACWGS